MSKRSRFISMCCVWSFLLLGVLYVRVCVSVFRCRFKWLSEPIVIIKYVSPFIDLSKLLCKRANEFCFLFVFFSLHFSFLLILRNFWFVIQYIFDKRLLGFVSVIRYQVSIYCLTVRFFCVFFSNVSTFDLLSEPPFVSQANEPMKKKIRNKINYKSQLCMKITSILSTAIRFFSLVMLFS